MGHYSKRVNILLHGPYLYIALGCGRGLLQCEIITCSSPIQPTAASLSILFWFINARERTRASLPNIISTICRRSWVGARPCRRFPFRSLLDVDIGTVYTAKMFACGDKRTYGGVFFKSNWLLAICLTGNKTIIIMERKSETSPWAY